MATQISNPETPHRHHECPTTMRAVVYRGVNDMRVETVPVPTIGPGELLVKIATCGICGTDLKKIHTGSHSAPRIFGHEMAGTIVARRRRRHRLPRWRPGMSFTTTFPAASATTAAKARPRSARSTRRPASPPALSPPAAALPSTSA